jgi:hypothetical protein
MAKGPTIEVHNVISSGHVYKVDKAKYEAMKAAVLKIVPGKAPGMTPAELKNAALPHLPDDLFPAGDKAGWWLKCVQLDLEAKGVLRRVEKPVRVYRA